LPGRTRPVPTVVQPAETNRGSPAKPILGAVGQRYFDYELLGLIAHGGMGVVYKARQLSLNRPVALKVIRAGSLASPDERRRFRTEAETVARLDHPNIVPIYEVGDYAGQPFLSMKMMEGGSLAQHIPSLLGNPRTVARLLIQLAEAVDHAHRHGVLHRDLKPANVLLDEHGHAYVTDFGLCKRFEADSDLSQSGTIVGTPMYMAPEQAAGRTSRLTVATDIHGLGAILYECLTGQPPFRGADTLQTLTLVQGQDATRPSKLRREVPRDLDIICLKCLQKDPTRRYPGARALADDLERFLNDEPIQARPVGRIERVWRWVGRHPLWTVILVGMAGTVGLAGWAVSENLRAASRARDALESADQVYEAIESWLDDTPNMDDRQRKVIEWLRGKYETFSRQDEKKSAIRRQIARSLFRLGQLDRVLKDFDGARDAYERAITLQEQLCAHFPSEAIHQEDLAESHNWLGELYREQGQQLHEAEAQYQRALELQSALAETFPDTPTYRRLQARSLFNLGIVQMDTNRRADARRAYDRAIALLTSVSTEIQQESAYRHELARCRINRGILLTEGNHLAEAEADFSRALALLRELTSNPGTRARYRLELAILCNHLGNLYASTNRAREARSAYEEALALTRQLVLYFPKRPEYRKELGLTHNNLAAILWSKADPTRSKHEWMQARDHFAALVKDHGDVPEYQANLGMVLGNLGWLLSEQSQHAEACTELEKAIRCYEVARKANRNHPDYLRGLRQHNQTLAETRLRMRDPRRAAQAARALAQVGDSADPLACYFAACFLARCASMSKEKKYAEESLGQLTRAIDLGFRDRDRLEKDRLSIFKVVEERAEFHAQRRRLRP
jgi:serine/threonine-protein kinase